MPLTLRRCYNSTSAWRSRATTSSKPDGRARAFAQLRGVLSEAATPIERDEELRYIADRLRLSDESVRYLLAGRDRRGGRGTGEERRSGRAHSGGRPPGAMGGVHELEVRFLAGCLRPARQGARVLAGLDESYFATAETRAALPRRESSGWSVKAQGIPCKRPGNAVADDEAGEVLAEVVVRAGRERFTATVVDELFLRLQEAQVEPPHREAQAGGED